MNLPSWDVLFVSVMGIFMAFAVVALHSRIIGSVLSAYAAFLIAGVWGRPLFALLTGGQSLFGFSLSLSVPEYVVLSGLFVALWLLFTTFVGFTRKVKMPLLEVIVHAFFAVSFALSAILSYMTDEQRQFVTDQSVLARLLYRYHDLLLIVPVLFLLFSAIRHDDDHRLK